MITYWCDECQMDSAMTEQQAPKCFGCDSNARLTEIKREKFSPDVMAARMKAVADRMLWSLQKAHEILREEIAVAPPGSPKRAELDQQEAELLAILAKSKFLNEGTHHVADGMESEK